MKRFTSARLALAALILGTAGCTVPQMQVDPALSQQTQALPVYGRDGWWVEQQLHFGEYQAGPVRRGWTKGYDYPFFIRFTGAREKLYFPIRDNAGGEAVVNCMGKLREQDLRVFQDYFDVNINTTDTFAGTIRVTNGADYDFYVDNLNTQQNLGYRALAGEIKAGSQSIELRSVWRLEGGQRWLDTQPIGVEFVRDGAVIASVETVNEGRVWLQPELDAEDRLLVAAVATALLLRSDLTELNEG